MKLTINSESKSFDVSPRDRLLDMLRATGYFGVKHGGDEGTCGCGDQVIADGRARWTRQ